MTLEERRLRLREWLDRIYDSATEAIINQHIFWEVHDIIRTNPELQNASSAFYQWMGSTFVHSTVLAVRRQVDSDRNSVSLIRFLRELQKYPELISRSYHETLYSRPEYSVDFARSAARHTYDRYVGPNADVLDVNTIQDEIQRLNTSSEKIHHYADRVVAHYDSRGITQETPKFDDVRDCLRLIEEVVLRYVLLLKGAWQDSLLPTFQYDWKNVFRVTWIPPTGEI